MAKHTKDGFPPLTDEDEVVLEEIRLILKEKLGGRETRSVSAIAGGIQMELEQMMMSSLNFGNVSLEA